MAMGYQSQMMAGLSSTPPVQQSPIRYDAYGNPNYNIGNVPVGGYNTGVIYQGFGDTNQWRPDQLTDSQWATLTPQERQQWLDWSNNGLPNKNPASSLPQPRQPVTQSLSPSQMLPTGQAPSNVAGAIYNQSGQAVDPYVYDMTANNNWALRPDAPKDMSLTGTLNAIRNAPLATTGATDAFGNPTALSHPYGALPYATPEMFFWDTNAGPIQFTTKGADGRSYVKTDAAATRNAQQLGLLSPGSFVDPQGNIISNANPGKPNYAGKVGEAYDRMFGALTPDQVDRKGRITEDEGGMQKFGTQGFQGLQNAAFTNIDDPYTQQALGQVDARGAQNQRMAQGVAANAQLMRSAYGANPDLYQNINAMKNIAYGNDSISQRTGNLNQANAYAQSRSMVAGGYNNPMAARTAAMGLAKANTNINAQTAINAEQERRNAVLGLNNALNTQAQGLDQYGVQRQNAMLQASQDAQKANYADLALKADLGNQQYIQRQQDLARRTTLFNQMIGYTAAARGEPTDFQQKVAEYGQAFQAGLGTAGGITKGLASL